MQIVPKAQELHYKPKFSPCADTPELVTVATMEDCRLPVKEIITQKLLDTVPTLSKMGFIAADKLALTISANKDDNTVTSIGFYVLCKLNVQVCHF